MRDDKTRTCLSVVLAYHASLLLLAMPLPAAAAIFGIGDSEKVAIEVAALDEPGQVGDMALSPDGRYLAADPWGNGTTDIWDLKAKKIVHTIPIGGTGTDRGIVRFSPDGHLLAICHNSRMNDPKRVVIDVFDAETWQTIHQVEDSIDKDGSGASCRMIAFSGDGKLLIRVINTSSAKDDNDVIFYDTSSWTVVGGLRTPIVIAESLAVQPKGKLMAISGQRINPSIDSLPREEKFKIGNIFIGESIVADTSTNAIVRTIKAHAGMLTWSPDAIHLAIGDAKAQAVRIFNSNTGDESFAANAGSYKILLQYTADGKYLIEAGNKQVKIWDAQRQNLRQTISADPYCMALSADGRYLALGGSSNSILDATPLLSLFTHPNGPAGKIIVYQLK